jgi:hypothetical protein
MTWNKTKPENDMLLIDFPATARANWEAIENGTDPNLQVTDAKVSPTANISDTKLAQIATANKVNGSALTGLANTPSAAGVLPAENSPNKLKADASDTTPEYLDSLIDTAQFQISGSDTLQLKDGGIGTEKLVNGSAAPGNTKYYGTNAAGQKGFFDMGAVPDLSSYAKTLEVNGNTLQLKNGALVLSTVTVPYALNSNQLNGQLGTYYRCSGCTWTCMTGCTGSCNSLCSGSCIGGCGGDCQGCSMG